MNEESLQLDNACAKFRKILEEQLARVEDMKSQGEFVDYSALDKVIIGVCGGDGIGRRANLYRGSSKESSTFG